MMASGTAGDPPVSLLNGAEQQAETGAPAPAADEEIVHAPAARYVRRRMAQQAERLDEPTLLSATTIEAGRESLGQRIRSVLIGKPIPTEEALHERIGVFKALAMLSSDALSSVAYGTEASLAVLVTAGVAVSQHNVVLGLTVVLLLAANTSFADFPRLSSILARDSFLPHFFSMQGDRLVFNTGIMVLGVLSAILLVVFHGNTDVLINLYALGVFLAFTLSQSGMVKRWVHPPHAPGTPLPPRENGWVRGMLINLTGALATGVVTVIIAIAKFDRGAWVVVILIPLLYAMFQGIHHHYAVTAKLTKELHVERPAELGRHIVVVPVARIDSLSLRGLAYARALSRYVLVVHVATSDEDAEAVRHEWQKRVKQERFLRGGPANDLMDDADPGPLTDAHLKTPINGPELIIVDSPYRTLARPIIAFVDSLRGNHPHDIITVVLPEFVPTHFWENLLHNQTVLRLKLKLLTRPTIVTVSVPYSLRRTRTLHDAPARADVAV